MHALEDLRDALAATRSLLVPFEFRRWLRLAFVTFFLGGVAGSVSAPVTTGDLGAPAGPQPEWVWLVVGVVLLAAAVVGLAFTAVRSVMEFVLYESLRAETVALGRFWSRRWRQGLRLFGFRLLLGGAALTLVGVPLATLFLPGVLGDVGAALAVLGALLFVPLALVVPPVAGLVHQFTTAFVVPTMVLEDCGVVAGWRRFWPALRAEWPEFLAYAAVNLVLTAVAAVAIPVGTAAAALALLVPFGPLFAVGYGLAAVAEPLGLAVLVAVGAVYAAATIVVAAFVKAPAITYLRYYAVLLLGDLDEDLDLVAERRAAVRAAA